MHVGVLADTIFAQIDGTVKFKYSMKTRLTTIKVIRLRKQKLAADTTVVLPVSATPAVQQVAE